MSIANQLSEALGPRSILEASLGRIWQHHGGAGFVILTAWRADQTEKENKANLKKLKGEIKGAGYGFVPVEGVGQETVKGKIVQASEPSLLVPAMGDMEALRKRSLKWGKVYKQFAVLIHDPKTGTAITKPDGSVVSQSKKFSANTATEFFTRLKGGRTFTLEWWGLKYGDPPEGGVMAGYAEQMEGRVQIAGCSDRAAEWLDTMRAILAEPR